MAGQPVSHDFGYVHTDIPEGMTIREWRRDRAADRAAARQATRPLRRRRLLATPMRAWIDALRGRFRTTSPRSWLAGRERTLRRGLETLSSAVDACGERQPAAAGDQAGSPNSDDAADGPRTDDRQANVTGSGMSIGRTQLSTSFAIALFAVLMLSGCGGDSADEKAKSPVAEEKATSSGAEEKAMSSVCDARADINDQVKQLGGLTASTVTADKVSQSLDAIGGDLRKIKDAQGDLADDRKAEIKDANQAFAATVKSTLAEVRTSVAAGDAKAALTSATKKLEDSYRNTFADSYRNTFAPIDCS